jgi:NTE family protein
MARNLKRINLALQGGGAHGAFAWGVLDALLEDERIEIEAIAATSAGSMNACALAYGMHQGGREVARAMLDTFWHRVSEMGQVFAPVKAMPWEKMMGWNMDFSASYFMFDTIMRQFSPAQINPMNINPLRDLVNELIDFSALRQCNRMKLFLSATHVRSGKVRVFDTPDITLDVVMASACLPQLFAAVMIDGEPYWDGGFTGNPALFPLFYKTESRDIMIVHLNPIERLEVPDTASRIMDRVNEISFNASLLQEIRAIAFVQKLVEQDMLRPEYKQNFKDVLLHSIRADKALQSLSLASKFSTDMDYLLGLRDEGRRTMKEWLKQNYDLLGVASSVDLHDEYLYFENKIDNKVTLDVHLAKAVNEPLPNQKRKRKNSVQ